MSNQHLSIVRDIKDLKGPQRAVLIVLADRADDNGTCYPGMGKIARESGFCRSTVKTALKSLKESGLITWRQRKNDDGELTSNLYTLTLPRAGDALPRAGAGLGVGQELTYPRAGAGHKASLEASDEATLFSDEVSQKIPSKKNHQQQLAEQIYQAYPRKVAKKPGLDAIERALKKNSASLLLEKTKVFAAHTKGKERRFIPHPATWFNEERFNDDPEEWKQPSSPTLKPKPTKADEFKL